MAITSMIVAVGLMVLAFLNFTRRYSLMLMAVGIVLILIGFLMLSCPRRRKREASNYQDPEGEAKSKNIDE